MIPGDTGSCERHALNNVEMVVFKGMVMKQRKWVRDEIQNELNYEVGKDSDMPTGQGLQKCPHSLGDAPVTPSLKK